MMRHLGILVATVGNSTVVHSSEREPFSVHLGQTDDPNLTAIVSYNPEDHKEIERLMLNEQCWLNIFEECESYGDISPILLYALIRVVNKKFHLNDFAKAIKEQYNRSRHVHWLLDTIWQISLYASKNRQRDIINVISQFDPKYTVTAEKPIVTEAVSYCQKLFSSMPLRQQLKIVRNPNLSRLNIFDKMYAMDAIIGQSHAHSLDHIDNKLIILLKWRYGYCDSFDYNTLKSFFHCFHPSNGLEILRKIAYEISIEKSQLTVSNLVDLVDSNTKIKQIQNRYYYKYRTTLYNEILVHGLSAHIDTGKFLSQGRIIDIINGIEDQYSKIEFGLRFIFDCCDGGLNKNAKYKDGEKNPSLFDGAIYVRTVGMNKDHYLYERLKYPCNGRRSSHIDKVEGKKFLWCNGHPCFRSAMRKQDDYRRYKFKDFCSVFGFTVYEETDCGLIPNYELSRFHDTLSKVSRIAPHLYCESCKQLLLPNKRSEKEHISAYNMFSCRNHNCEKHGEAIYINHCYTENCRGVIDGRLQKKCPNGMYICSECFGCCSDDFYLRQKELKQFSGLPIPSALAKQIENNVGHNDKDIFYCYECGTKLADNKCPNCGIEFKRKSYYKYTRKRNDTILE